MRRTIPPINSVHSIVFDFDGVFTDNKIWVDQDGRESVRCDRGDGLAFDIIRSYQRQGRLKAELFVLSKESNSVVLARTRKLKLVCHQGIHDKLAFLRENFAQRFPDHADPFSGLIYLGNDLNDLPVMRHAGFTVAPADAHPRVQKIAHLVMAQRGGDGFVRNFIEQLLKIDKLSLEEIDELISNC